MTSGNLFAWLIFGLIGMAAFGYGKKQQRPKILVISGLLMVYPYLISNTIALWAVGVCLTTALFVVPGIWGSADPKMTSCKGKWSCHPLTELSWRDDSYNKVLWMRSSLLSIRDNKKRGS